VNTATREAILAALKGARDIADAAENGGRALTDDERGKVTEYLTTAADLRKGVADQAALRKQLSDLSDGIGMPTDSGGPAPTPQRFTRAAGRSLGKAFTDSDEYRAMLAAAPNGQFSEKSRVQSAPFGVKDLLTGINRTTGAGSLLVPDQLGMLDPYYQRPLTVRDLVTPGNTTTDVIEYVKLVSVTNNAAPVPEATTTAAIGSGTPAVTGTAGGVKPESGMAFAKDSTTVKTIAHWIPATKRALADVAQIQTLIDAFLYYGLDEELEDQILSGNGTGENFLGLGSVSGTQAQTAGVGDDVFTVTRRARTKVRTVGRATASAYVMHPLDWESIELKKDGMERYYGAGPFALSAPTLWGLPVVESEAMTQGTAWVADWKMAVLYDREQASIQATDTHADFFVRNLVAILAELRAAFAVLRPPAFVKITLPA
jgi:HK97 family phage major capsid protein